MKKINQFLLVSFCLFCLSSCQTTNFHSAYNELPIITSYTNEKWLFTTSDVPDSLQSEFDKEIIEVMKDCFEDNFIVARTAKNNYLLPGFSFKNNENVFLQTLHQAAEIHFYLNVKAEILRSEVGSGLDLNTPPAKGFYSNNETRIRVTFDVFDVLLQKNVYSQSVIGITRTDENNREDVLLTLPFKNQFKKAFKKSFKIFQHDIVYCQ
jgi:hypothetical protein